jgi:hypothetical protein
MKHVTLTILAISAACACMGQRNINGLVNAERKFAEYTSTHTIKEGFLKFMDSSGVIFRQGMDLNALDVYRRQPAGPGILSWEPSFAIISASGDMGATTGPYEFRAKSAADTVSGYGTFLSVWRINKQDEWKNIADFGTSYRGRAPEQPLKRIVLAKPVTVSSTREDILQLDRKFNKDITGKNMSEWMPYISTDTRFHFEGSFSAKGMLQIADAMQKLPEGILIATKTGDISSAGDFAYTYGMVMNGQVKNNYLRVWIYRNGQWQVILQTLKW